MRDVVTADDWKAIISGIQGADDSIRNLPQTLSEKAVGEIDCKVDSMSKKVDDSLALALEIKDGILVIPKVPGRLLDKLTLYKAQSNRQLLDQLPAVMWAVYGYYEQDRGVCLEGTQTSVLRQIQDWSSDPHGQPICWLQGMAGTGKSTIARTVAAAFHNGTSLTGRGFLSNESCLEARYSSATRTKIVGTHDVCFPHWQETWLV